MKTASCALNRHLRQRLDVQNVTVIQVRGPLTALRTLGSILVPRLRQKEGQEIDRDVAQGILTQVLVLLRRMSLCAVLMLAFVTNPACNTSAQNACNSVCSMFCWLFAWSTHVHAFLALSPAYVSTDTGSMIQLCLCHHFCTCQLLI